MLVVLRHNLSVSRVRCQIHGQGNEFLAYDWLRAVDNELVDDRNALSVSKGSLEFVLLRHVVEQLEDKGAEAWRF